ncbi:MAG: class I SAM-dependent methyltransferase [Chitinophagales bacterium]
MLKKLFRRSTYRGIQTKLFPYKLVADEFYDALYVSMNGATLFVPENIYCIDYAIRHLPTADPVVEIGSFTGMSTCMLSHYLSKYKKQNVLFNADKWEFEEKEKNYYTRVLNVSPAEMKHYIRESFLRNLQLFSRHRLPATIELFSDEFFQNWQSGKTLQNIWGHPVALGGPISFAYLDGNHQFEFVKRDFENVHRHLAKGGFVFFDDSAPGINSGMRDFIMEVKARSDYEVVLKNPNYLVRKIQ